jgi:hypothetical protein
VTLDFEELRRAKRPNTGRCDIALDPEPLDVLDAARAAHQAAKDAVAASADQAAARAALADAEEALEAAEERATAAVLTFRFRGLAPHEYDDLVDVHQPTPEQVRRAAKAGQPPPGWNEDTFPQALVAACLVEPPYDPQQVAEMWKSDDWNGSELGALFGAAYNACRSRRVPDLGKGSGRTQS